MLDVALLILGLVGLTATAVFMTYLIPRFPDICLYCWFWPANLRRAIIYRPQHASATILLRVWGFL